MYCLAVGTEDNLKDPHGKICNATTSTIQDSSLLLMRPWTRPMHSCIHQLDR